ncbi:MAG: hypothetical protein MSJ26_05495 [Oscillospiraceae bacterium]|nr:hypothetical protein [Oscillospiraceae bacterium]
MGKSRLFSCPSLKVGSTYSVEAGGQSSSVTLSSLIYSERGMGSGRGNCGDPQGGFNNSDMPRDPGDMDLSRGHGKMNMPRDPDNMREPADSAIS